MLISPNGFDIPMKLVSSMNYVRSSLFLLVSEAFWQVDCLPLPLLLLFSMEAGYQHFLHSPFLLLPKEKIETIFLLVQMILCHRQGSGNYSLVGKSIYSLYNKGMNK